MDLDSPVETVYGNQQGAAVDFNSQKRRRKSYHPLLVYEGQSRTFLNASLRASDTGSSTDVLPFAEETLELLGPRKIRYARYSLTNNTQHSTCVVWGMGT